MTHQNTMYRTSRPTWDRWDCSMESQLYHPPHSIHVSITILPEQDEIVLWNTTVPPGTGGNIQ